MIKQGQEFQLSLSPAGVVEKIKSEIDEQSHSEIDVGIGTVLIKVEDDKIVYSFAPSTLLRNSMNNDFEIIHGLFVEQLEKNTVDKFLTPIKENF